MSLSLAAENQASLLLPAQQVSLLADMVSSDAGHAYQHSDLRN